MIVEIGFNDLRAFAGVHNLAKNAATLGSTEEHSIKIPEAIGPTIIPSPHLDRPQRLNQRCDVFGLWVRLASSTCSLAASI